MEFQPAKINTTQKRAKHVDNMVNNTSKTEKNQAPKITKDAL